MRIFLTGGSGFIGRHLVPKLLAKKHQLLILSRKKQRPIPGVTWLVGSLGNIKKWQGQVRRFRPQALIHLAWEGIPDYSSETSRLNLLYSLDVLKLAVTAGCKKILVSGSSLEYGGHIFGKMKEDSKLKPFNAFTAAKNCLRFLGERLAKENNAQFIWVRIFYAYGPGQRSGALIPSLIRVRNEGQLPEVKFPHNQNDFVYVTDVAEALVKILEKCRSSQAIYNIGSGQLTSVAKISSIIFGRTIAQRLISKGSPEVIMGFYADISKIKKETGWYPQTDIRTGIRKFLNHGL